MKSNYTVAEVFTHAKGFNKVTITYQNPGVDGRGYYVLYENLASPLYLGRERNSVLIEINLWLAIPGTLLRIAEEQRAKFLLEYFDLKSRDYCVVSLDAGEWHMAEWSERIG